MPYTWTDPEIAVAYGGTIVYHTYKSDDIQNRNEYHFTLDNLYTENGESESFDVRDLEAWVGIAYRCGPLDDRVMAALKRAIDTGELFNMEDVIVEPVHYNGALMISKPIYGNADNFFKQTYYDYTEDEALARFKAAFVQEAKKHFINQPPKD
jgi:hypothetical protein